MIPCSECGLDTPPDGFHRYAKGSLASYCVPCAKARKSAYDKARYAANPKPAREKAKAWQRENVKRKQEYDAEYRERNRERRLELKRRHSREMTERGGAAYREYRRLAANKRQAKKASNGVFSVSVKDIAGVRYRQRDCCFYCGTNLAGGGELDHVMPITRGGAHGIGNIVLACTSCNRSKSHRTVTEWRYGRVVPRETATHFRTLAGAA